MTFLLPWTRSKHVVTQGNSSAGVSIGHNVSILSCLKLQNWETRPIKGSHCKVEILGFFFFLMEETDEEMRRERRRARVRESKPAIAVLGRISSKLWI